MDFESTAAATAFGSGRNVVSRRHFRRDHALDSAEQFLVFEFFITEANQRLQRDLVAGPVKLAQLENLAVDEAFHQAEDVRVRPSLDLAEENRFVLAQKLELINARKGIRQELVRRIELAAPYDVLVDVPAHALGSANTFGILFGLDWEWGLS